MSRRHERVDDRGELAELRRHVAALEEQHLNDTDALVGAEAAAAQARRDIDDIFHRLHVREKELEALKKFLGFKLETPIDEIIPELGGRPQPRVRRRSGRSKPRR